MKRRDKETQRKIESATLDAIRAGETNNKILRDIIFEEALDLSQRDMLSLFCATYVSRVKQKLRQGGFIEISKGNIPIAVEDLQEFDINFIDARRTAHIRGELKTRIEFNRKHGREAQAHEAEMQLAMFTAGDRVEAEAQVHDEATV